MKEKYLPIGTVCTIKGNTNRIMIVGFLALDYNGNVNIYDYKGCTYPQGLFSSNGTIAFNHADIEKIEFLGYETDLHKNLNSNLVNASVIDTVKESTKSKTNRFTFDENGVVVIDSNLTKNENLETTQNEAPKSKYQFDENGNVIGINNDAPENPFTVEYNEPNKKANNKFKFDENGVIIEDNSKITKDKNSQYVFDENGFLIAVNK